MSTATAEFDPDQPIDLVWQNGFEDVVRELGARLRQPFKLNLHLTAWVLLARLRVGLQPTPSQVIGAVYVEEAPPGGWIGFDHNKWLGYVPQIIAALNSEDPYAGLNLRR